MPSDRRFHPLTVLFALGGELRNFLAPILFASFTARSRGGDFENWLLLFMIPSVVIAGGRYWFSTYRYDSTELVVRTGIFFKNERHIPYARIQSVDASQNVLHRAFGVVDVRVQTGTGGEAEATLSVLPMVALAEMRERVFAGRHHATTVEHPVVEGESAAPLEAGVPATLPQMEQMLRLGVADTFLSGVFENRGWVVIGAASGMLQQAGLFERMDWLPQTTWMIWAAVAGGLFVVSPLLSAVWAVVRLHGFTLTRRGEELLTRYGAWTRITGTIPLRRVQAVTIVRGLGHQLSGRAAIRADTAGGGGDGRAQGAAEREWIAPILPEAEVAGVVQVLLPSVQLDLINWQRVDDRAGTREVRVSLITGAVVGALSLVWVAWYWAVLLAGLVGGVLALASWQLVRRLRWFECDDFVAYRSGWLSLSTTIVPTTKIQAVGLQQSWFDRRWGMASVSVDTAGASHPVHVRFLDETVADHLRSVLASRAAATEYKW